LELSRGLGEAISWPTCVYMPLAAGRREGLLDACEGGTSPRLSCLATLLYHCFGLAITFAICCLMFSDALLALACLVS